MVALRFKAAETARRAAQTDRQAARLEALRAAPPIAATARAAVTVVAGGRAPTKSIVSGR
eukprot:SAG22_NODE_6632_length_829_cov_1.056164_1_plen_59_part_10